MRLMQTQAVSLGFYTEKGKTMREKLIEILRCGIEHHEELKEKWIIGGKVGERPSIIKSFADILVTNDVVQVVRCKDCTQYNGHRYCRYTELIVLDNDFCSYGERKDNG